MKGTTKKLLCVLMAIFITVGAMTAVGFTAADAEDTAEPTVAEEIVEETVPADNADLAPVAVEPGT